MGKCKFYMENNEIFEKCFESECEVKKESDIKTMIIENGVVLPLKENENTLCDVSYSGGAADSEYNFAAGLYRGYENMSCVKSYVPDEEPVFRDEEVVFGGILFNHFGHMLTDSMSRFWYFARNPNLTYKIVFLCAENEEFKNTNLLDLMDISPDRYEIIKKPTRFKKVLVPGQAFAMGKGYADCWLECFDYIKKKIKLSDKKKIFLSRFRFSKNSVNEIYYMNFFEKRGFEIIFPEELPLEEQISLIGGAEEIAAVSGTLIHLCQFCRPDAKLIVLSRTSELIKPLLLSIKARGLECSYIEANINFMPTTHAFDGVNLLGPTEYFKKYLHDNKIEFSDEELELGEQKEKIVYDYLKAWTENYSSPFNFKRIAGKDIFNMLEGICGKLLDMPINPADFNVTKKEVLTKTLIEVGKMLEGLDNENKRLINENKMLRNIYAELKQNN